MNAHKKKQSQPILHESLILLIEGFCKNKSIASSLSTAKHKSPNLVTGKMDESVKKITKVKLKPSSSQIEEEDTKVESIDGSDKEAPKEEEGIDARDFRSNLYGYPNLRDNNEEGREEDTMEVNLEQRKSENEDTHLKSRGGDKEKQNNDLAILSEEENMGKASTPLKKIEGHDKVG